MKRSEVVGGACTIQLLDRRLWELDEILDAKGRGSRVVEDVEVDEVDG